jgi:DNA-binding protein HU-beta
LNYIDIMNKTELIERIAAKADISRAAAGVALDATLASLSEALVAGDSVSLVGFGTFKVGERAARTGKNPATGAALEIPASKSARFTPGKALKDALNAKA